MTLSLAPLASLLAGVLILVVPRLHPTERPTNKTPLPSRREGPVRTVEPPFSTRGWLTVDDPNLTKRRLRSGHRILSTRPFELHLTCSATMSSAGGMWPAARRYF
jgi:hypothetical protein